MANYGVFSSDKFVRHFGENPIVVLMYEENCEACDKMDEEMQSRLLSLPKDMIVMYTPSPLGTEERKELEITQDAKIVYFDAKGRLVAESNDLSTVALFTMLEGQS
jgi:hypothetical protein